MILKVVGPGEDDDEDSRRRPRRKSTVKRKRRSVAAATSEEKAAADEQTKVRTRQNELTINDIAFSLPEFRVSLFNISGPERQYFSSDMKDRLPLQDYKLVFSRADIFHIAKPCGSKLFGTFLLPMPASR